MSKELFQTDSSSLAKNKHKTLNIGVIGPISAGKSEFIKYLIKDNECKGFEITGSCFVNGLRVYYNESETVILNVTEFRGDKKAQLREAERWNLDVYFLFYDVSDLASFKEVKNLWLVTLYERAQPTFVMGSKVDKPEETKVMTKMPDVSPKGWKSGHVEISSITGINVNPFIKRAIEIMLGVDVDIQQDLEQAQPMQMAVLPTVAHPYYDMSGTYKGICLIISIRNVVNETKRDGAEKDEEKLKKLFVDLGFDVRLCPDLTVFGIYKTLEEVSKLDHSKSKCFVLFVLSHGKEGCILSRDNAQVPVDNIIQPFQNQNCKTLEGKPKLFFIQACHGEQRMHSRQSSFQTDAVGPQSGNFARELSFSNARGFASIPNAADVLVSSSTVNGYVSYRTPEEGSVFISVLVEEIEKSPDASIVDVLTRVNCIISHMEFGDGCKQMTCFRSMLRKQLVLNPSSENRD